MHKSVILRSCGLGAALTFGVLGLGCGGVDSTGLDANNNPTPAPTSTTPTTPTTPPAPAPAPTFPEASGQAAKAKISYPAGPYGINVGSIAPDYEWVGFQNPAVNKEKMETIRLSDFYNPHANDPSYAPVDPAHDDRLFQTEAYGIGTPKPKALSLDVGCVWCPPCNDEAKTVLPGLHAKYKPLGGEFLLQLDEGATHGKAATQKDLFNWSKKYKVDFPATIDPAAKLHELFPDAAWPANIMIDTRTMKIVMAVAGVPPASYWTKFEKVLNAQ